MAQFWQSIKPHLKFKTLLPCFLLVGLTSFICIYFQTSLPLILYGILGFFGILASAAMIIQMRFVQAEANQYLLLIENGKLVKSGVGIRVFKKFSQSVVIYNSNLNKIDFSAHNVTKEWQGVKMSGFIMYTVHRDDQGPYQYYQYMLDYNSQQNLRVVCESIVRHQISNMSIDDIQKNRILLNQNIIQDLKKEVANWGIWIETVEIIEADVMSYSLNQDLQVEFEQESMLKAQKMEIETNTQITVNKMNNDMILAEKQSDQELAKLKTQNLQKIQKLRQEINLLKQQIESQQQKAKQDKECQIANENRQNVLETGKQAQTQEQQQKNVEASINEKKEQIELSKNITSLQMHKYIVEKSLPLFKKIVKNVKVNQYNADFANQQN